MIAVLLALFHASGRKMSPTSALVCARCGTSSQVIIGRHCTACIGKITEEAKMRAETMPTYFTRN